MLSNGIPEGADSTAVACATARCRVLIVEDERIVATDLQQTLRRIGYDPCAIAASGLDALEQARAQRPDMALMDIRIKGGMDGIETARLLREQFGTGVIFLTAHADDSTVERAARSEPYGYLLKPITTAALKSVLQVSMHRWGTDRRRRQRERALQSSHSYVSSAMQHLNTGILGEDGHGRVSCANDRLVALLGIGADSSALDGCSAQHVAQQISALTDDPAQFLARVAQLVRDGAAVSGEVINLACGLVVERDFAPIVDENGLKGHLWSYRDVTQREHQRELLEQRASQYHDLSHCDELTGLLNRRGFFARAERQLATARRDGLHAALMYVDINGLKQINDNLGHDAGDQALRELALILKVVFRGPEVVARLGGDEFVILCCSRSGDPAAAAERVRARLREFNSSAHQPYTLQASVGIAMHCGEESIDTLLRRGDEAMYGDKRVGKADIRPA